MREEEAVVDSGDKDPGIIQGEKLLQTEDVRNIGVLRSWFPKWVKNTVLNYPQVDREFAKRDLSLLTLARIDYEKEKIERGWRGPAIICGSGVTLNDAAPLLKNWKGGLFATASQAKILKRWGRQPDYIGMFDCGDAVYGQIRGTGWRGTILLANPSISPLVMKWWRWEKRYYVMMHYGHDWFEDTLPVLFPYIRCSIMNAGSTGNNLVQAAHFMGYKPLFLVGMDLGFTPTAYRCDGFERPWSARRRVREWAKVGVHVETRFEGSLFDPWVRLSAPPPPANRKLFAVPGREGFLTTEEQIEYKLALFSVQSIDKSQLINCSPMSLVDELPYVPLKEVIENGGKGYEHLYRGGDEIVRICKAVHLRHENPADAGDGHEAGDAVCVEADGNGGAHSGNGSAGQKGKAGARSNRTDFRSQDS
ncbi:MAG: DUF115 domain-containing protein [Chloroflexi bacterium]|nr:DUF115 domain-containing protein [Chloroflexota bacterium]